MEENLGVSVRRQFVFWLIAFAAFLGFIWLFSSILLPFLAGMALAYFLDPVADWFEERGANRLLATAIILVLFVLVFSIGVIILVPLLVAQIADLLNQLPIWLKEIRGILGSLEIGWLRDMIGLNGEPEQENFNALVKQLAGWVTTLIPQIWASGLAFLNVISLFVVTPVVAFYLLYDWDHIVEAVDGWLPRDHRPTIRDIFKDIDLAVAGFVRGQVMVCIILGIFYATGLMILGVNFGLLIGIIAGVTSFIPFVGAILGFGLSVGVAIVQFWPDFIMIAATAILFGIGQFIEGNILQPKLVGEKVGLHPVWLMFALFAFGSLFGFTGMLIAVPTAAAIGVVTRFALGRYLESDLYKGHPDNHVEARHPTEK